MLLSILDRINLLNILPREGDITTLRIVRDLGTAVGFSEAELSTFNIQHDKDAGLVTWDTKAATDVDIPIGPRASTVIGETLTKLSEQKKLTPQLLGLYEKFVDGGGK